MRQGYTKEKNLIWGKTYAELSKKHIETVCTAGVLESGKPVRLYSITYRYLNDGQFTLYQWITADIQKNPHDTRPESYKIDCDSIRVVELVPATQDECGERGEFTFRNKSWQFESADELQEAQKRDWGIAAHRNSRRTLLGRSTSPNIDRQSPRPPTASLFP
jgi:hypothetical protein